MLLQADHGGQDRLSILHVIIHGVVGIVRHVFKLNGELEHFGLFGGQLIGAGNGVLSQRKQRFLGVGRFLCRGAGFPVSFAGSARAGRGRLLLLGMQLRLFNEGADVPVLRRCAEHFLQLFLPPGLRVKETGGIFALMAPGSGRPSVSDRNRVVSQYRPQVFDAGINHRNAAVRRFLRGTGKERAQHGACNAIGIRHGFLGELESVHLAGKHQPSRQSGDAEADNGGDENKGCGELFHRFFLLLDGVKHRLALFFVPYEPGKVLVDKLSKFMLLHRNTTPSGFPAKSRSPASGGCEPCCLIDAVHLRLPSA